MMLFFLIFVQFRLITSFLSKNKNNKLFIIFLLIIFKQKLLTKTYKKKFLKRLFENFIEKFNILDNNCI